MYHWILFFFYTCLLLLIDLLLCIAQDYAELDARSTEWTNEKHCLYLKSMEASFVNELHCSMGLFRGGEKKRKVLEKDLFQQVWIVFDSLWLTGY